MEQCSKFILKNLKHAEIIQTPSNGKSAEIISKAKDKSQGAIIPLMASEIYGINIISKNVQDNDSNFTRFFILSEKDSANVKNAKTSILVKPSKDKPGLLYSLLGEFAKRNINLTKIESRPSKEKLGDYLFYIDFIGHRNDNEVKSALESISRASM